MTLFPVVQIQPARAVGIIYINADGTVEPPSAPINRNMDVYTLTADISASIVVDKSNVVIDGNGFTVQGDGNGRGFLLSGISRVTIKNTVIRGFEYGIYLESASYNTVCFNEITTNALDGIGVRDSTNNRISWNNIAANKWFGIGVYYSSGNSFDGNNISRNYDGIGFYDSSNNVLLANKIAANTHYGLGLYASLSNLILHNNFENNARQIFTEYYTNTWDNGYPNGGNFWSDLTALDLFSGPYQNVSGSDNISDTPYLLNENNRDRYPLMRPWTNIAISDVPPSKTVAAEGATITISLSIQNQGWNVETTSVTAYANTAIIATFKNVAVTSRNSTIITFTWNTTGLEKGNQTISAYAEPVPGETDTTDNTFTTTIVITLQGDINADRSVDIYDAITLANAYSSAPNSSNWNPDADINNDNVVDIYDAIVLAGNYGKRD